MIANFDLWEIAMEFELSLTLRENGNELMPPAKMGRGNGIQSLRPDAWPEPGSESGTNRGLEPSKELLRQMNLFDLYPDGAMSRHKSENDKGNTRRQQT